MSKISESIKAKSYNDEELANEIKKKLQEKNWDEYDKLIKISRERVYAVEKKRFKNADLNKE